MPSAPMCGAPGTACEWRPGAGGAFHPRAHRFYAEIGAHPGAVPYARHCARQALAAWKLGGIADDAELIASELVTNAVAATRGMQAAAPVALYLAADPGRLTVLVWDACPGLPAWQPPDDEATAGRGLAIVQALSDRWGCTVSGQGGKVVWAWLGLGCPGDRSAG
jgi:anti-sigma regulatory factor (Ser/Thr protein kinase)